MKNFEEIRNKRLQKERKEREEQKKKKMTVVNSII